jgi:competence protein ComEC
MVSALSVVFLLGATASCSSDPVDDATGSAEVTGTPVPSISSRVVSRVADLPAARPAAGAYRVHLIDVGTGLAILVQGSNFNLLFDGGSNDDRGSIHGETRGRQAVNTNRLLAYLYGAIGPSGEEACVPDGDKWPDHDVKKQLTIDHLFLSHPHNDHNSMLADVVRCYDVKNVWDSGDPYASAVYAKFLNAVAAEPGVRYHTAAQCSVSKSCPDLKAMSEKIGDSDVSIPAREGFTDRDAVVQLDDHATFKILHADATEFPNDANRNSIVLRLQLGNAKVLFVGDAESGDRKDPSNAIGDVEADLVGNHADDIKDIDIFQVGHHGSKTSNRLAFLNVVNPKIALIGCGPTSYGKDPTTGNDIVLPDAEVVSALAGLKSKPTILRTDAHDADLPNGCTPGGDRIGVDDASPGGCDNFVVDIE